MDTFPVRRCIGIVLAVLLVIILSWFGCGSLLKADEYVPMNEVVHEEADEVIGATAEGPSTVRTVLLTLSQDAPAAEKVFIPAEEVPGSSLEPQGPNRYLMLASVFVPMLVGAVICGICEQKKKKESFYSFTAL